MPKAQLKDGYTRIANELVEAMAQSMPGFTEGQIIWCVLRKTYGWNKKTDKISISQLVKMTGKSRRMIIYSLKSLEAKKMIIIKRAYQQVNKITFNKNYNEWVVKKVAPSEESCTSAIIGKDLVQDLVKNVPKVAPTKETITKDTIQKTTDSLQKYIDSFNDLFEREFRTSKGRDNKLKTRLKVFSLEEILIALENLSKSPWHRGVNSSGWTANPDFLIRNDEKVDEWLNKDMNQAKELSNIINKKEQDDKSKIAYIS